MFAMNAMLASHKDWSLNQLLRGNGIYAAIGCHPHGAVYTLRNLKGSGVEIARMFMSHPKVVAVGEIGE